MVNSKLNILIFLAIVLTGIFFFLQKINTFAIDGKENKISMPSAGVINNKSVPAGNKEYQLEELNSQLEDLEILYKFKQMTEEEYKTEKADLQEKIKNLEK